MFAASPALEACASLTAPPPLLLRLAPETLGRRLALMQLIQVQAGGTQFQFEALLEADEASLRLAVLAFGRPMVRLIWDGQVLRQDAAPQWPAAVSAERMLSDLTLALWPADAVAAALPAGWSLRHDADGRELRWQGTAVQRVRQVESAVIELEHLALRYRMRIESRTPPAPPGRP
jgi:hypothetical protein